LVSLHFCTSESWGGLELYACTVMHELQLSGDTVYGVCRAGTPVAAYLREHDIPALHLPDNRKISLPAVKFIRSGISSKGVGVVHVHFHRDIWNASLAVSTNRSVRLFLSVYMGVGKKTDLLHRFIYKRVDGVFTSSHELKRRLHDLYPIPASKIHFLPYGRDLSRYTPDAGRREEIRKENGIAPGELCVGTMVRIDPGKGVMDFVKSFAFLPKETQRCVKYLVVGEPTRRSSSEPGESPYEAHCEKYFEQIRNFVRENGIGGSILFAGFQKDLVGYLGAMDVFVFPSYDELYSLVVLDALSMRLPVVAARAGGTVDQITDGVNGLMYTVGGSRDCAGKIADYCSNPSLRKSHGDAGRKFVEETHSMEQMIRRLKEYYRS
jgi:D-inositol-3-phosphate glycosyltransferase